MKKVVRVTYKGREQELALQIAEVAEPTVVCVDAHGHEFSVEASRVAPVDRADVMLYWELRRKNGCRHRR